MLKKIILLLLIIYALLGFIAVPLLLKPQIMATVAKETNSKLSIDSIYLNPFIFRLQLDGVILKSLDNKHLASFSSLEIDLEPLSLMKSAFHIKNIILSDPKISIVQNKDKTLNFSKILKDKIETTQDTTKEKVKIPRIIIDIIKIKNGGIDYEDFTQSKKFNFSLHSIGFSLKDVDTNHFDSSDAKIRFYSALDDGGFIDFKSEVIGFHPLRLKGDIDFKASKPYSIWKYIQDMTNLEVANGKLFFSASYYLNMDFLDSMAINNLQLSLKDLRVKPKNRDDDVLNLKYLNINDVTIKPLQQNIHVKNITLNSLNIKAKRDKNGNIDWLEFIKNKNTNEVEKKKKTTKQDIKTTPWDITLDKIILEKIAINFNDKSVKPQVKSIINELNINLDNVTLLGEKPFTYNLNLLLNDKFQCNSQGDVIHKSLEINSYLKCKDFNLIHYKPYIDQIAQEKLKTYNIDIKSAFSDFNLNTTIKNENTQMNTYINNANLSLNKVLILQKDTKKTILGFSKFDINSLKLNTKTKNISIKKTTLNNFVIDVKKDKNGTINLTSLIEPKESKKETISKKTEVEEKAYIVKLKHFQLHSAKINFKDESIKVHTKTKINKINLNAYNIDSREKKWLDYNLTLNINNKGNIYSKGEFRHTPLKYEGSLKLDKISLKEFTPYIQESTYLKINDGYLSLDSQIKYSKKTDKPDLKLNGNLKIEEFFLHDSRDNSTIASFTSSELKSFNLNLFPNSLYIDEVTLNSFYIDAIIDENKVMNLAKLTKPSDTKNNTDTENKEDFVFKVMKVSISDGSANFADFSLPVKFKTSIHDLNGNIYAISNSKGEISYVDMYGEIDKYGSTKLKGSIETSNIKSYTDIDFNFKNLGLSSLSGYSAQFAGYKIDKGKLYLDLGYKIYDSSLLGKNSVIIKNIELGDEIEDENITKLPLGFAIALLEDSDGIIDIDMPVEGNLDKPDFKYGALVLKTFGRLILKAVASPFTFLGSLLGIDGDDLKYAEFEAGEFKVLPPQKEKLDNIVKILTKKPKLSLGITGSYNTQKDTEAIQSNKLRDLILQKSANKGVVIANVLEDIYTVHAGKDIVKAFKAKMRKEYKKDEIFNIKYQKKLMEICKKIQKVTSKELVDLADKRASMLQKYLVLTKNIDISRTALHKVQEVDSEKFIETKLEIELR